MSLTFDINITRKEFEIIHKALIGYKKEPTRQEQNIAKKVEFIIEDLRFEEELEKEDE